MEGMSGRSTPCGPMTQLRGRFSFPTASRNNKTPSRNASGRGGQPGTYTSTGRNLSTPCTTLEMSYLLVILVAISTKQQERPKLKGHTEFLRPHATRSSRRDRISVRRIASSEEPSFFLACGGASGRLIDHRIKHRPS